MYPFKPLSDELSLLRVDFADGFGDGLVASTELPIARSGVAHGVVVWVDYQLLADVPGSVLSTGLSARCVVTAVFAVSVP